ncbi:hypothetical protein OFN31_28655, partial [Escherichia coli]|nr:hypothetical protein [Escherichia coli]
KLSIGLFGDYYLQENNGSSMTQLFIVFTSPPIAFKTERMKYGFSSCFESAVDISKVGFFSSFSLTIFHEIHF